MKTEINYKALTEAMRQVDALLPKGTKTALVFATGDEIFYTSNHHPLFVAFMLRRSSDALLETLSSNPDLADMSKMGGVFRDGRLDDDKAH